MSPTRDDLLLSTFRAQLDTLRPQVIRPARGFLRHDFCVPGGYYPESWDWDGFFIATHLAGRPEYGPRYLQYWALNFLAAADPAGYVPGCITTEGPEAGHRSFQMKPFLAQGAELAGRLLGDDAWVADRYDTLCRIVTRREATHRDEATGLFYWDTAVQSGADNNPALSNDPAECRMILACDINAFQWREYLALSRLAGRLGRVHDSQRFAAAAEALARAVNTHLWCDRDGTYCNCRRGSGDFVRRITYSNFVPLWAGMAVSQRAGEMIDRYLWNERHMLSPYGLRSLSRQDAAYNNANIIHPYSNWQGPIWPIANYLYFVALIRAGRRDAVADLIRRLAAVCSPDIAATGSLHENYDAETGAPLAPPPGPDGKSKGFVGWNLLMVDMMDMLDGRGPEA